MSTRLDGGDTLTPKPSGWGVANGGPWWATFIRTVGVSGAIALGLVYFVTQISSSALAAHAADSARALEVLIRIATQICMNAGDTPEERNACFRAQD